MKVYGCSALTEILAENVVYRNIEPADPNLPGRGELAKAAGLTTTNIPRKTEQNYALMIVQLIEFAQRQRCLRKPIQRLVFLGDTRMLDGTAFRNICQVSGWAGVAFIGSEDTKPVVNEVVHNGDKQSLFLSNRWQALADFTEYLSREGHIVDETTAVVVDIDKTALGARGRNGHVIDQARVSAVQDTVASLLGDQFSLDNFRSAYTLLVQPQYHAFTTDNQDYVAYICLILGTGMLTLDGVLHELDSKHLETFEQFIASIDDNRASLPIELLNIHSEIYAYVQQGDPTPFKIFRRKEYLRTIRCFGSLDESIPVETRLDQEILITQEVRQAALNWKKQGGLLIGLSDKPDEAATPTPELAQQGFQPIHRMKTHVVGANIVGE